MSTNNPVQKPRGSRRGLKIVLGIVVLLIVLVALAPTIAGFIAPGIISGAASKNLAGKLTVGSVGLSWFGKQQVGPIRLTDPSDPTNPVAVLEVTYDGGLAQLATAGLGSSPQLRTVQITGNASLLRSADGTTNLERALAPKNGAQPTPAKGGSSASGQGSIPEGLKAHVTFNGDVNYTDASGQVGNVQIKGISADMRIGESGAGNAKIDLDAKTLVANSPEGTLKVNALVSDLTDAKGNIQAGKATVDATVESSGLPVAVVDALAGMGGRLLEALGPTLKVSLAAKGTLANADAKLVAQSEGVTAEIDANITDNVLTARRPMIINAKGRAVRALADLDNKLKASGGQLAVGTVPDVNISVDSLKVRIPLDGKPLDLRGSSGNLKITTTEAKGTVRIDPDPKTAPSAFTLAPLNATLTAADFAGEVKFAAATDMSVGGKPGGSLKIDLAAAGLLDKDGKPNAGIPPSLKGEAMLKGIATAIAQPFVAAMKLDLPNDIGPTLDANLKASTAGIGKDAVMNIDVALNSQKLTSSGSFEFAGGVLKTKGDGFNLRADQAGALAGKFLPEGWALAPSGQLTLAAKGVSVPFKDGDFKQPLLDKALATVDINASGLAMTNSQKSGTGALDIASFKLGASLLQNAAPKVQIDGQMGYQGRPFTAKGAFDLPGLIASDGKGGVTISADKLRPVGSLTIENLPTTLMQLAFADSRLAHTAIARIDLPEVSDMRPLVAPLYGVGIAEQGARSQPPPKSGTQAVPATTGQPTTAPRGAGTQPAAPSQGPSLDLGRVISEAVGPTVNVSLSSQKGQGEALDLAALVKGDRLSADAKAVLGTTQLDVKGVNATVKVSPSLADYLLATFAPDLSPRPALVAQSDMVFVVEPTSLPLKAGGLAPDLAKAGQTKARLYFPGPMLVRGLAAKNEDGTTRDLGQIGLEEFQVTAEAPLSIAAATGKWANRALYTATGQVVTAPGARALTLNASGTADLSGGGGAPMNVDALDGKAAITNISPSRFDTITGKPGMLAGALGDTAKADIVFSQKGAAAKTTEVTASVTSPKLSMSQPIQLAMLPDRIQSKAPFSLAWQMDPTFGTQYLLGGDKTPDGPKFAGVTPVNITVSKLAIATGEGNGPLKPGIFDLDLAASVPTLDMLVPGGEQIKLAGTSVTLASGSEPGSIKFNLGVNQVASAKAGGGAAQKVALNGFVTGLADAKGNVSGDNALLTASGEMPLIPTSLIDAFAKQDGMIVDALGPTASVAIKAEKFGKKGGTLDLKANSPRASASVKGAVKDQIFVASEPVTMTLTEISPELTKRFTKGLPFIGKVEKTKQDAPATVTATGLRAPMNGDMHLLDGDVIIALGQARISTGGDFLGILKQVGVKKDAQVGKHIQPMKVAIRQGVAKYEKWSLPIGEFDIDTEGTIDLGEKRVDVYTFLPIGALTNEAAGVFKLGGKDGLGGALDKVLGGGKKDGGNIIDAATKVPWRTRGTFDKTKTEPDLEMWGKEFIKQVPGQDILNKGLDSIFKKDKK